MSNPITPTIGRVVIYVGTDGRKRPALIVEPHSDTCVSLDVSPKFQGDTECGLRTSVLHRDEAPHSPGDSASWHWMAYQKQVAAGEIPATKHAVPPAPIATEEPTVPQTGPRITKEHIDDLLARSTFTDSKQGTKSTVVCCRLPNGFEVIESSGCVDPVNYDHDLGVTICKKRITDKVWLLEGYRLACEIAEMRPGKIKSMG